MIPQRVQTMRGPKARTSTASGQLGGEDSRVVAEVTRHGEQRTPSSRMLPSVIGGPGAEGMTARLPPALETVG